MEAVSGFKEFIDKNFIILEALHWKSNKEKYGTLSFFSKKEITDSWKYL